MVWGYFGDGFNDLFFVGPVLKTGFEVEKMVLKGAFHHAKDSGNFGRNSNGQVRFGLFRPEYSG